MAYIKPQSPLKLGEDHLYPLTTYDQIIMEDGNRWDGKSGGGELDVDLTGASQGVIALTNADLLGGNPPSFYLPANEASENYALKTDTAPNALKLSDMTLEALDVYFEKLRLDREHPVGGAPYITFLSADEDNPNTKWPWSTWELDSRVSGRMLIGANDTYALGSTGGEATHKLTTAEMPSHTHSFQLNIQHGDGTSTTGESLTSGLQLGGVTRYRSATASAGSGAAHNNMPPYIAVNIWKRTM